MASDDCATFCGKHLLAESRFTACLDVAAGQEAPRWVGWTGLDGRASRLRLLLTSVSKLNVEYIRKNVSVISVIRERLNVRDWTIKIPRYLILSTQGIKY